MPDWSKLIRDRMGSLNLPPAMQEEILAELSAHLEDIYEEQRAAGMNDSEAQQRSLEEITDWRPLAENIERAKRKEEPMNSRTKQFWIPGTVSLAGSMGWMMALQKIIPPSQTPFKHAGVPILPYLLWAVTLPLIGAASGYLSQRGGGSRRTGFLAVLVPSIVMAPLWLLILVLSHHPTQWAHFFFGVAFWVIVPAVALMVGAAPFLKDQTPARQVMPAEPQPREHANPQNALMTFWLPALVGLSASMIILMISTITGRSVFFMMRGLTNQAIYLPWLLLSPLCGAAAAYLSRRAGGPRHMSLAVGVFPAFAMLTLGAFLAGSRMVVFAKPQSTHALLALVLGVILPGTAQLLGALPISSPTKLAS